MAERAADREAATLALLQLVVEESGGESRAEQNEMALAITRTFSDEKHLLVQAGTGVGKSLAYLAPVFLNAAKEPGIQLISTSSLALQRQIIEKDAPAVQKAVEEVADKKVDFRVLKGWSNYLCKYRLDGGMRDDMLWSDPDAAEREGEEVAALSVWAQHTETGDRDEVDFPVSNGAWNQVSVSKRECAGSSCPFADDCFPALARQRAFDADVVVTNHSLLGVFVNGRQEVLPEFTSLVVDEAHELAGRVRQQGSEQLTPGIISAVAKSIQEFDTQTAADLRELRDDFEEALNKIDPGIIRLRPDELHKALADLGDALVAAKKVVQEVPAGARKSDAQHLARGRIADLLETLDAWNGDTEQVVTWVGLSQTDRKQLNLTPLNVAYKIRGSLLEDRNVVFTSATLKTGGNFDAFRYQTGLDLLDGEVGELDVGTPFVPERQGILYVASHLPPPGDARRSEDLHAELTELATASKGGMLGLFSSTAAMREAAAYLRENTSLPVLLQGEDSLPSLLKEFAANDEVCLIGTLSLWQGVDVPGPACRLVAIDRIPFPRPDDPVTQALGRLAASRGRNAFTEVSLAPASVLLAQGAGRLLRKVSDRGVVAVLDSRIAARSYGAYLRRSLPPFWETRDPQVVREALSRLAAANENERK